MTGTDWANGQVAVCFRTANGSSAAGYLATTGALDLAGRGRCRLLRVDHLPLSAHWLGGAGSDQQRSVRKGSYRLLAGTIDVNLNLEIMMSMRPYLLIATGLPARGSRKRAELDGRPPPLRPYLPSRGGGTRGRRGPGPFLRQEVTYGAPAGVEHRPGGAGQVGTIRSWYMPGSPLSPGRLQCPPAGGVRSRSSRMASPLLLLPA
jgi:hypothetical protein